MNEIYRTHADYQFYDGDHDDDDDADDDDDDDDDDDEENVLFDQLLFVPELSFNFPNNKNYRTHADHQFRTNSRNKLLTLDKYICFDLFKYKVVSVRQK